MDIGMLWYSDDRKQTVEQKVMQAAVFYSRKYGLQATECHIHPRTLGAGPDHVGLVRLVADSTIVQDHFWLGIGDAHDQ